MGTSPSCSTCCTDLNRRKTEASFAHGDVRDPDAVLVTAMSSKNADLYAASVPIAQGLRDRGPVTAASSHHHELAENMQPGEISSHTPTADRQSDDESCESSEMTASSTVPDMGKAQQVVKSFVRTFVKGRKVSVLTVNGATAECIASLDRQLTTLSLQRSANKDAKKRGIALDQVQEVCIGDDASEDIDLPLDDLCVTLLLEDGNAIGFRFEDVEDRDVFALCLSMFVDGRRGELRKQQKHK